MNIQNFLADLKEIVKVSEELTAEALFIAGVSVARSQEKLGEILQLLIQAQVAYDNNKISKANKAIVEFHFYQGQVDQGKQILKTHLNKPPTIPTRANPSEISRNAETTKKPAQTATKPSQNPTNPGPTSTKTPQPDGKLEDLWNSAGKPKQPQKAKLTQDQIRQSEAIIAESLNILQRIDEKEILNQRKSDEQRRLQAEIEAKELKEKLEREYQEKLKAQLEAQRRIEEQAIRCNNCKDKVQDKDLAVLEKCGHFFHKKCIKELVLRDLESKVVPICCWKCKSELAIIEINANLTKKQAEAYSELTFKDYMNKNNNGFY